MATPYVCQQCRVWRYPDCKYEFHPTPPEWGDPYREPADAADIPDDADRWRER